MDVATAAPHYAPLEGKNENPVQHQVDDGRNQAAAHGQFGRTVQPDDEQGYGNPDLKGPRRHKPLQVVNGQGNQIVGGSEQPYRRFRKNSHYGGGDGRDEGGKQEGLRYIEPRHLAFAPRKVDGCHYGAPHANHQPDARVQHIERYGDVYGRYSVATHSLSHKDAVNGRYGRHAQHAQQRGDKVFSEKFHTFSVPKSMASRPCAFIVLFFVYWV